MGLAEIQKALAQIYIDSRLRDRFLDDPQRAGIEMGLSDEEAVKLREISSERLNLFAESLKRKRLNEAEKLLPAARRLLGSRFSKLFLEYAETFAPKGVKKHLEDVENFSGFLSRSNCTEPQIEEIARYEAARLTASDPRRRLVVRLFRFPIKRILKSAAEDSPTLSTKPSITIAIWFRPTRLSGVKHFVF